MAVWNGLLFGMLLQLSVGPVCIAVLQRSVGLGFRQAWWMAAGVALVDAAYMAAAMGGLAFFMQIPLVKNLVVIGGAVTLIWFGVANMWAKAAQVSVVSEAGGGKQTLSPEEAKVLPASRARDSFFYGVVLTMTNPLTILFWAGVFGSLMASRTLEDSRELLGFAAGCVLSTLSFLTVVSVLGAYVARFLQPVWMERLNKVVGLFLIGFAIALFFQNASSF